MVLAVHTNAGVGDGDGEGDGAGSVEGDALGLGVPPGFTEPTGRRNGLLTYRMPTISAVMTHAATAAIQYVLRSGCASATAERTRSRRLELGAPLTSSMALFSSRRKLSLGL